jgi:peptidoglycan/xylan/chitin deacetylase (PgdA/CDA1 family)
VDWARQGPGIEHILARKDRFEKDTLTNLACENPYNNINDYITIEEKFGVKSTFFFRVKYENGKCIDYEDEIQTLLEGGWEIGLHCDPASVDNFDSMYQEKKELESITKKPVRANRSHFLAYSKILPNILNRLGFVYDSSVMVSKSRIGISPPGFFLVDNVIEFPITIMDAYMFTYMHVTEDKIINTIRYALGSARKYKGTFNILTIVWHSNVLKMTGGRKYKEILEYLSCQKDVKLVNGTELSKIIDTDPSKAAMANRLSLNA